MKDGISGAACPEGVPFAGIINTESLVNDFFPCIVGAIKMNETGLGDDPACVQYGGVIPGGDPTKVPGSAILLEGTNDQAGLGLFQLTSSFPSNWYDAQANIEYAIEHFMVPAYEYWRTQLQGDDLVRAIAAEYNGGRGGAMKGHNAGNLDAYTTNNYASRALAHYKNLVNGDVVQ